MSSVTQDPTLSATARDPRRGSILQSQVTGTLLLAVLSAVSVTSAIWINRSAHSGSADQGIENRWLLATANDAVEHALDRISAGRNGTLVGQNSVDRGWSTRVTDLGESLRLRANSYSPAGRAMSEAMIDRVPMPFAAAVYVEGPGRVAAGLTASGIDHSWDRALLSATPGIKDFASHRAVDEASASLGTDSIAVNTEIDLKRLCKNYQKRADRLLDGGSYHSLWGDAQDRRVEVVYITGDAEFAGSAAGGVDPTAGAGILVIDGDVRLTGSLHWIGAVLVTGDVVLCEGADADILGTLLVGGQVKGELGSGAQGRCQVLYSSAARDLISNLVTFEVTERILGGPPMN